MNKQQILIREIELSECDDFYYIEKACFSTPWSKADFEYQITNPNAKIIGAFFGEEAVGYINLQYIAGELTVNNLAVTLRYRGKGMGEKLLSHALNLYPDAECALLEVRKNNIPAQRLYEKHGFVKVGERKNYYSNPTEDAILMTKNMKVE